MQKLNKTKSNSYFLETALAWLIATNLEVHGRDPDEAIRLASRSCELVNQDDAVFPTLLGTLAAAYASAERFR